MNDLIKTEIDVAANGRVNLLGEHLDYNGGYVLPLQIKNSVKINLIKNYNSDEIIINSKQYNERIILKNEFKKRNNWSDFLIGACKVISEQYHIEIKKIIFNVDSDLPIGVGLSSSAATSICTIKALIEYFNLSADNLKIVNLAFKIERDFIGVKGGMMDQFTSVFGNTKQILFLNTRNMNYELIPLPNDYIFLIVNSGTSRILKNSNFNQKKEMCISAAKKLNVKYLCEISQIDKSFYKILTNDEIKIAKHVITENMRVKKGRQLLLNGDFLTFGKMMTESHLSLKNDYQVSSSELDKLVAISNEFGSLGSKLTGAGFGGAIVTLIKKSLVEELKKYILKNYSKAEFI